jgi:hypothetical protein
MSYAEHFSFLSSGLQFFLKPEVYAEGEAKRMRLGAVEPGGSFKFWIGRAA